MKNSFNRRSVLKGLAGGLTAATAVTTAIAAKSPEVDSDAEIMALWDEFKAVYSVSANHPVIVENGVVVARVDRTARDIWKQADKIEPKTPLGSTAKIAMSVLSIPVAVVADEWIAGADMTEVLGYYSPFHGLARELARVNNLNLDGLRTPAGWRNTGGASQ